MKKLSRDEMKNVMGGTTQKTLWNCLVQEGTPGGAYYTTCAYTNPESYCGYDEGACYAIGSCNSFTGCVS